MSEKKVYMVTHVKGDIEAIDTEDDGLKIIGIFSSMNEAEAVVTRFRKMPGFSEYPNGFGIDPYIINKCYWDGGFVSASEA